MASQWGPRLTYYSHLQAALQECHMLPIVRAADSAPDQSSEPVIKTVMAPSERSCSLALLGKCSLHLSKEVYLCLQFEAPNVLNVAMSAIC